MFHALVLKCKLVNGNRAGVVKNADSLALLSDLK